MPKEGKNWSSDFIKYMEMIINHPNYKGLPIKKKEDGSYGWIAPAKSEIGQARIEWCNRKAIELGRVAIHAVYDYNKKKNRNLTPFLTEKEIILLKEICRKINAGIYNNFPKIKIELINFIEIIEDRIILSL